VIDGARMMDEGEGAEWRELRAFWVPPRRRSLGKYVYETLKEAIVTGELPEGRRVVESRVAAALGISRTPVREAIHMLDREGLLTRTGNTGYAVTALSREEIVETFGIRGILESYAARLAAARHRQRDLRSLEERIETYQMHLDAGRLDALSTINTEFHDLLYALSGSPRLVKMINDLRDPIYRFRRIILKRTDLARRSNEDHREMLRLMRERDEEGVERVVREHIRRGRDAVLAEFDEEHRND